MMINVPRPASDFLKYRFNVSNIKLLMSQFLCLNSYVSIIKSHRKQSFIVYLGSFYSLIEILKW